MIGMTRSHRSCSSWVGTSRLFASGFGAPWVVRIAYLVPGATLILRRNLRAFPFGFPKRPGELKTYRSAWGSSFGLASRMCQTLTVIPLAAMIFLNSCRDHGAVAELRSVIISNVHDRPPKESRYGPPCQPSRFRVSGAEADVPETRPGRTNRQPATSSCGHGRAVQPLCGPEPRAPDCPE